MSKQTMLKKTFRMMNQLPESRVSEISSYVQSIFKDYEDKKIQSEIEKLAMKGSTFAFLEDEEDLYSEDDIIKSSDE